MEIKKLDINELKKIANNTYIITPYNVDVMGDLLDELENNGMFFV